MQIRPLDLHDDQSMRDAYFIECVANQKVRLGWVPLSQDARILGWRVDDGWRNHLIGAWDGPKLRGFAAGMNAVDTPETTWVFAWVAPEYQKTGIGSALVRSVEATCLNSTTRFVSSAYRPSAAEMEQLIQHFSQPLGYVLATTETVVELDLSAIQLPETYDVNGYNISTYVNGVPERYRSQVGRIKGLVDAEAPNGELGWAESPVSAEEYASEIDLWVAQGHTVFESIAVDAHGNVAAWTCLLAADETNRPALIEGTLVVTAHRGRALGRAIKIACLNEAGGRNNVQKVRTSSDDENVWMQSINTKLGFLPVETEVVIHKHRVHV